MLRGAALAAIAGGYREHDDVVSCIGIAVGHIGVVGEVYCLGVAIAKVPLPGGDITTQRDAVVGKLGAAAFARGALGGEYRYG